jgi:methylmalonyl-CoA mutase N-terminal domain/subunit
VQAGIDAGLDVDQFAPRLSFFFNAHNDFFEEIAKFRAARRIWAKIMKERFRARDERSLKLRFHAQTSGVSLAAQQPYNNVIRVTLQALAAVLGGAQSLHTNSLDETLSLPTESAVTLALRTQQIIAHESGVVNTADPLGGSYFVEALTDEMERGAFEYFDKIDAMGGMVAAIEKSYPQREIHESAYRYQQQLELREKITVGVNDYVQEEEAPIPILKIDDAAEKRQVHQLQELRRTRDNQRARQALQRLEQAARGPKNLMPDVRECVKSYCTLGEICDTLRGVFGLYQEPSF